MLRITLFAFAELSALAKEKPGIKCFEDEKVKACYGNLVVEVDEDHNPLNADQTCREWCSVEECKVLDGNLTQECGFCNTAAKCNPAADDWAANKDRTKGNNVICTEYCGKLPCEELTGNPHFECGGCDDTKQCHPGADHFDDWFDRLAHKKEL